MLSLGLGVTSSLTSVDALVRGVYSAGGVLPRVALDFDDNKYVLDSGPTSFNKAFMGTSPRLTYSTSSNSTMVNSSGEIVWAPHNLLEYSEDFSTAWADASAGTTTVTSNSQIAPDGTLTADTIVGDNNNTWLWQSLPASIKAPASYTFKVWLKAPTAQSATQIWYNPGGEPVSSKVINVTTEWKLFEHTVTYTNSTGNFGGAINIGNGKTFYIWGAHVYRSDLGGMASVPGAVGDFQYYVPTNGAAVYLPRVGHHVYNGSTWVNEGLLIESEARTNLITSSQSLTIGVDNMFKSTAGTVTNNAGTFLDGSDDAVYISFPGTSSYLGTQKPVTSGVTYVFSFFAKPINVPGDWYITTQGSAGIFSKNIAADLVTDEWVRVHLTFTAAATTTQQFRFVSDYEVEAYICGFQLEAGPTPSSYIPTSGSTVTRGGQSLTVPPAQFGWPEPEYIGPDLVVEGSHTSIGSDWSYANGVYTSSGEMTALQTIIRFDNIGIEEGKVYSVLLDIANRTAGDVSVKLNGGDITAFSTNGTHTATLVGLNLDGFQLVEQNGFDGDVSNISVREINPLSVSIQMDGRMNYADGGTTQDSILLTWSKDVQNRIYWAVNGTNALNGALQLWQVNKNIYDNSGTVADYFAAGFNVPFNIASRHGSNFIQSATDGVLTNLNDTPTALPDLSNTNLQIAYDFMGTIGQFRQFSGDMGDTGLEEATS